MKSKAGRPKLEPTLARNVPLLVRITKEEKKLFTLKATVAGKKLSEWVRGRLLE